jgi:hypothetical protein
MNDSGIITHQNLERATAIVAKLLNAGSLAVSTQAGPSLLPSPASGYAGTTDDALVVGFAQSPCGVLFNFDSLDRTFLGDAGVENDTFLITRVAPKHR